MEVLFNHLIAEYEASGQIGTRDNYIAARNSLLAYGGPGLTLDKIDRRWLEGYEKWAQIPRPVKTRAASRDPYQMKRRQKEFLMRAAGLTTIGMYLRNLRHVFNECMDPTRRIISRDKYPFGGKDGYVIRGPAPSTFNVVTLIVSGFILIRINNHR